MITCGTGWKPDPLDHRDRAYRLPNLMGAVAPEVLEAPYDLRPRSPLAYDQLQTQSCVGNSVAYLIQYNRMAQSMTPNFVPSRLFLYWCARDMERTTHEDSGCCIRDAVKAANKMGAPDEALWPFESDKVLARPTQEAFAGGLKDVTLTYCSVPQILENIVNCLRHGEPVVFGSSIFKAFNSLEVARSGIVPMPKPNEQPIGGHAMVIVGTNPSERRFIVRNSWGRNWGRNGHCEIPYEYILDPDLTCDLWMITMMKKTYA